MARVPTVFSTKDDLEIAAAAKLHLSILAQPQIRLTFSMQMTKFLSTFHEYDSDAPDKSEPIFALRIPDERLPVTKIPAAFASSRQY